MGVGGLRIGIGFYFYSLSHANGPCNKRLLTCFGCY